MERRLPSSRHMQTEFSLASHKPDLIASHKIKLMLLLSAPAVAKRNTRGHILLLPAREYRGSRQLKEVALLQHAAVYLDAAGI